MWWKMQFPPDLKVDLMKVTPVCKSAPLATAIRQKLSHTLVFINLDVLSNHFWDQLPEFDHALGELAARVAVDGVVRLGDVSGGHIERWPSGGPTILPSYWLTIVLS